MIAPKKYTKEEISTIIESLRKKFPEVTIELYHSDPRFIRFCEVVGEQRVDTIPVSIYHTEYIHIVECEKILRETKGFIEIPFPEKF